MTLYGIDIAQYQAGENLTQVKAEGFTWIEARASSGYQGGQVDPQFATFKKQAKAAGLLFVAYHFLYPHGKVPIAHQADVCATAIGDKSVPVMIDHETADGTGTPSITDAINFAAAMRGLGYRVPLWYLPHWVWQALGSPTLPKASGMALVSSSYVGGSGYASALYPGKTGPGWTGYGGLTPVIWQFTDTALVAGQHVDADAFEGTVAELAALLDPTAPSPGGTDDMTPAELLSTPVKDLSGHEWTLERLLTGTNQSAWNAQQDAALAVAQVEKLAALVAELQAALAKQQPAAPAAGAYQVTGTLNLNQGATP